MWEHGGPGNGVVEMDVHGRIARADAMGSVARKGDVHSALPHIKRCREKYPRFECCISGRALLEPPFPFEINLGPPNPKTEILKAVNLSIAKAKSWKLRPKLESYS